MIKLKLRFLVRNLSKDYIRKFSNFWWRAMIIGTFDRANILALNLNY